MEVEKRSAKLVNEPRMVIVEWSDPERNKQDKDFPICFGPYATKEAAQAAVDYIKAYQDMDNDPSEERLVCRLGTYKRPEYLSLFMGT